MVPVPRRSELLLQQQGWRPVQLSKADRAPEVALSEDRLSATSAKGFRMARLLHHERLRDLCVVVLVLGEALPTLLPRECYLAAREVSSSQAVSSLSMLLMF